MPRRHSDAYLFPNVLAVLLRVDPLTTVGLLLQVQLSALGGP